VLKILSSSKSAVWLLEGLGPWLVAVVAGAGAGAGSLVGYIIIRQSPECRVQSEQ
jgi:membrane protein YqaA with SNARE-associated domain